MKRDEQKPADNVEPKFKIEKGKWYVCIRDLFNGYMDKAFRKGDMYISTQDGSLIPSNANVPCKIVCCPDTYFRDWAIADAKDGDVLANGSNIFIFHFINGTRLMGYCHVNIDDGKFYDDLGANECFCTIDAIVAPATKEQCDLFFQKMTQAGYEWDNEKKELKKIEHKTGDKSVNIDIEPIISSYKQRLKSQGGIENTNLFDVCLTAFRHGAENVLEELNLKTLDSDKVIE